MWKLLEISSFKTTTPFQSRNCYKSVLSRPPHPPNVETVKNQFFQDHHTLPPHPPNVETVKNQFFQGHHVQHFSSIGVPLKFLLRSR